MDKVIRVRRSFLNKVRGLCNAFASVCTSCYKPVCDCYFSVEIERAKELIAEIDLLRDADEERFYVANPFEEHKDKIVKAVEQAGGKGVCSNEIHIDGLVRQMKHKYLKQLVARGRLVKTARGGKTYFTVAKTES